MSLNDTIKCRTCIIFLGLLSGHFMIDVYDGAYAEAHVGLLNFHVDIVKAFICFKGHIGYNLNVLKVRKNVGEFPI